MQLFVVLLTESSKRIAILILPLNAMNQDYIFDIHAASSVILGSSKRFRRRRIYSKIGRFVTEREHIYSPPILRRCLGLVTTFDDRSAKGWQLTICCGRQRHRQTSTLMTSCWCCEDLELRRSRDLKCIDGESKPLLGDVNDDVSLRMLRSVGDMSPSSGDVMSVAADAGSSWRRSLLNGVASIIERGKLD
jgi:hypothetical protein